MAWEWVPPVAGAVVAIGGLVSGGLLTAGGWRNAERIAAADRDAERKRWHLDRQAEAYLKFLDMAECVGQYVQLIFPMYVDGTPPPVPPPPSLAEQRQARILVGAFASDVVKGYIKTWDTTAQAAMAAAREVARNPNGDGRGPLHDLRIREARDREWMTEAISDDLDGRLPRDHPNQES